MLTTINHLAFITPDMTKTIRFYRDLLGLNLEVGIGHNGYRHYFFRIGDNFIAFFEYEGASPMTRKFHGVRTREPRGFDHVSLSVATCANLFAMKDRVEAAGFEVTGVVDHGTIWSIYFFDPNNIPLEISWDCMVVTQTPAITEDAPLDIVAEGATPQSGHWPAVESATPPEEWIARPGNGVDMRDAFVTRGWGTVTAEYKRVVSEAKES